MMYISWLCMAFILIWPVTANLPNKRPCNNDCHGPAENPSIQEDAKDPGMPEDQSGISTDDHGEFSPKSVPNSAFTVVRMSSQTGSPGETLLFTNFITNIGSDFSLNSGSFTCRIAGIYYFAYHISIDSGSEPVIQMLKNGDRVAAAFKQEEKTVIDIISNGVILQLKVDDDVRLAFDYTTGKVFSNQWGYTSFSGVLLHAD